LFIFVLCQIGFESFGELAPRQHDTPPTTFALEPDIRAQACDRPFIGATWMLLSEAEMIVEAKVR
jgi:hypothetical protein